MQLLSILMERHRKTQFHDFNASQQSGCLKFYCILSYLTKQFISGFFAK